MRVFYICGFTMLIGNIAAAAAGVIPCAVAAFLCLIAAGVLFFLKEDPRFIKAAGVLALVCAALVLQSALYYFSWDPQELNGKELAFSGRITAVKTSSTGNQYYIVSTDKINGEKRKTQVYLFSDFELNPYEKIETTGKFRVSKIGKGEALISATATDSVKITEENKGVGYHIYMLRESIKHNVENSMKSSDAALLNGMVFGDTSDISYKSSLVFSRSGINHVFSVSGLHIAVLNGIILYILGLFGLSSRKKAVFSIGALILLTLFVGPLQTVLRSVGMTAIYNLSLLLSRRGDIKNSLGFAVFAILLFDRGSAFDFSFLLSVFATLGIVLFGNKLSDKLVKPLPTWLSPFVEAMVISLCAYAGTLPIIIMYFDELSLIGIIVNALLSPVFTILLPLMLLICGICFVPFLGGVTEFLCGVCSIILWFIRLLCAGAVKIPFAYIPIGFDFYKIYYIIALAILIAAWFLRKKIPYVRLMSVGVCVVIFVGMAMYNYRTLMKNTVIYPIEGLKTTGFIISSKAANTDIALLCHSSPRSGKEIAGELLSKDIDKLETLVIFGINAYQVPDMDSVIKIDKVLDLNQSKEGFFADLSNGSAVYSGNENGKPAITVTGGYEKLMLLSDGSVKLGQAVYKIGSFKKILVSGRGVKIY